MSLYKEDKEEEEEERRTTGPYLVVPCLSGTVCAALGSYKMMVMGSTVDKTHDDERSFIMMFYNVPKCYQAPFGLLCLKTTFWRSDPPI